MRLAVSCENGEIFNHFGHTPTFKVYELDQGHILQTDSFAVSGHGRQVMTAALLEHGIQVVICGGLCEKAEAYVRQAGIDVFGGQSGSVEEAVAKYLAGTLTASAGHITCHH